MKSLADFAIATTRAWTATYTRGLPHDVRAERREEIDCDLWEQRRLAELERQPFFGTAAHVLFRLILGMPEDLLWRVEVPSSVIERRNSVNDKWYMRFGFAATALLLIFLIVNGVSMLAGGGDFPNLKEQLLYGGAVTVSAIGALLGLWLCASKPGPGLAMVVAGTATIAVLFYWMLFITIPVAIVIILFAIKRSGLQIWPFRAGPTATA